MSPHDARDGPFPLERKSVLGVDPELEFDVIRLSHTLEHIEAQHETMRAVRALLSDDGVVLISVPMIPCFAWEHYGTDWVQLDAPRHFFIHTPDSVRRLAADTGFEVEQIVHDSTAFQFWGSEQNRRGIALSAPASWAVDPNRSPFTTDQIHEFETRAEQLNAERRGDQVTIYCRPR